MPNTKQPPGTERARDEAREGGGPRAAGGPWEKMDERGDQRFGHTRLDDADPHTLAERGEEVDDDEAVTSADTDIESGGEREGIGRGEKPRKPAEREKPNPKPNPKTKKHH